MRRRILKIIALNEEMSYTELMSSLRIKETGKISFHLRKLSPLLEQNEKKHYKLSSLGKKAFKILEEMDKPVKPSREITGEKLAKFWKRVLAYLIDVGFVLMIYMVIGTTESQITLENLKGTSKTSIFGLLILLLWLYFTLFEGYKGQSIGKIILKTKTVRTDGLKVAYDDAAIRNFGKALFVPLLPLDILFGFSKDGYLKYFDWFTRTTVVEVHPRATSSSYQRDKKPE
ncbi:MAG: RDD family protein [Candidatus Methanofastidiosia archaeon]